jgi:hypothetical protein
MTNPPMTQSAYAFSAVPTLTSRNRRWSSGRRSGFWSE